MGFDPMDVDSFVSQKQAEVQKGIDTNLEDVGTYADMVGSGFGFEGIPANLKPDVYKELQKRSMNTQGATGAPGTGITTQEAVGQDQGPQYSPAREGLSAVGADGQQYVSTAQGTWERQGLGEPRQAVGQEPYNIFESAKDREKRASAEAEVKNYQAGFTDLEDLSTEAKTLLRQSGVKPPDDEALSEEDETKYKKVSSIIGTLLEEFESVPESQRGPIQGAIAKRTPFGLAAEATEYEEGRAGLAGTLKHIVGETGRLTDKDIERIKNILPTITDNPKQASIAKNRLNELVTSIYGKGLDREKEKTETLEDAGDNFVEIAADKLTDISRFLFPETTKLAETALSTKQEMISPEKRALYAAAPGAMLFGDDQINKAAREIGMAAVIDFATVGALSGAGKILGKVTGPAKGVFSSFYKASPAVQSFLSVFTIPTKLAGRLKPVETAREMIEHGMKGSLESMDNMAMQVTGDTGAVTKLTRKALGAIKGEIDIDEATKVANHTIKESLEIDSKLGKKIMSQIRGGIDPGEAIGKMNTLDSYNLATKLERTGWRYLNSSTYLTKNTLNEDIGGVFLDASKTILENVDEVVKSEDILSKVLSQEAMSNIYGISPRLAEQVTNAKTFSQLRSVSAPFVRLSKMTRLTQEAAQSSFQNAVRRTGVGIAGAGAGAYAGYQVAGVPGAIAGAGLGMVGAPVAQAIGKGTEAPIMTSASQVMKWLAEQGLPSSPKLINEILSKGIRGSAQMIRAAMSGEGEFDINSAIEEQPQGGGGMDIDKAVSSPRQGIGVKLGAYSPEGAKLYR